MLMSILVSAQLFTIRTRSSTHDYISQYYFVYFNTSLFPDTVNGKTKYNTTTGQPIMLHHIKKKPGSARRFLTVIALFFISIMANASFAKDSLTTKLLEHEPLMKDLRLQYERMTTNQTSSKPVKKTGKKSSKKAPATSDDTPSIEAIPTPENIINQFVDNISQNRNLFETEDKSTAHQKVLLAGISEETPTYDTKSSPGEKNLDEKNAEVSTETQEATSIPISPPYATTLINHLEYISTAVKETHDIEILPSDLTSDTMDRFKKKILTGYFFLQTLLKMHLSHPPSFDSLNKAFTRHNQNIVIENSSRETNRADFDDTEMPITFQLDDLKEKMNCVQNLYLRDSTHPGVHKKRRKASTVEKTFTLMKSVHNIGNTLPFYEPKGKKSKGSVDDFYKNNHIANVIQKTSEEKIIKNEQELVMTTNTFMSLWCAGKPAPGKNGTVFAAMIVYAFDVSENQEEYIETLGSLCGLANQMEGYLGESPLLDSDNFVKRMEKCEENAEGYKHSIVSTSVTNEEDNEDEDTKSSIASSTEEKSEGETEAEGETNDEDSDEDEGMGEDVASDVEQDTTVTSSNNEDDDIEDNATAQDDEVSISKNANRKHEESDQKSTDPTSSTEVNTDEPATDSTINTDEESGVHEEKSADTTTS